MELCKKALASAFVDKYESLRNWCLTLKKPTTKCYIISGPSELSKSLSKFGRCRQKNMVLTLPGIADGAKNMVLLS